MKQGLPILFSGCQAAMPIIKNKQDLSTTPARRLVLNIVEAGITRVLPSNVMKSAVGFDPAKETLTLSGLVYKLNTGRVFVIGGGKASGSMADELEKILPPENITAGIVTCKSVASLYTTRKIKIVEAGHPLPDQSGVDDVKAMLGLKSLYRINEHDLVICLISGGGSALLPCPVEGISLDEKRTTTELLIKCGADINEINVVWKHLSRTKGGRLGQHFSPATVVSLIISDVVGDRLTSIASGPTTPDDSTFSEAMAVIEKHSLTENISPGILDYLKKGVRGEIPDTPRKLDNCHNFIIGNNKLALDAMKQTAETAGKKALVLTSEQTGETGEVAANMAMQIISGKFTGYDVVLIGGETTPKVPWDTGKGGRNQHYVLTSVLAFKDFHREWTLASAGTDGSDFVQEAAGAIVDNRTLPDALNNGIDVDYYLRRYDSYTVFEKMGESLIITGDTGTNVGDVIVYATR